MVEVVDGGVAVSGGHFRRGHGCCRRRRVWGCGKGLVVVIDGGEVIVEGVFGEATVVVGDGVGRVELIFVWS